MGYAVLLCAVASLSTGIGGVIVALFPNMTSRELAFSQGFAAGVMVGISFMDMLPKGFAGFAENMGIHSTVVYTMVLFCVGWIAAVFIAKAAVPCCSGENDRNLKETRRLCLVTTAVIVLHNLPEGMLTCITGCSGADFAHRIVFAVALHNIPEGMAVASSVVYLTKSRFKAVARSFAAGFAELTGGVAALLVMHRFADGQLLYGTLAVISGVMVQVSLCQLVPGGIKIHSKKAVMAGITAGLVTITIGILTI